jgi:uncharacterized membrane protein
VYEHKESEDTNEEELNDEQDIIEETPLDKLTKENTEFNKTVGKIVSEDENHLRAKDYNIMKFQRSYSNLKVKTMPRVDSFEMTEP